MDREMKARIARENGARSKGPKTEEGKKNSRRNAITHGQRATALKLIVPPHSACLANEDRQAFYKLFDTLTAKYRPEDEAELALVREIADFQWKINRNKQMETAIYNRELVRQGGTIQPSMPELRHLEISIAAHEALTGNKTIAGLRRDTQASIRAVAQLQRRLLQLQRQWPGAAEQPPVEAQPEETPAKRTEPATSETRDFPKEIDEEDRRVLQLYERFFSHPETNSLPPANISPHLKSA